MLTPLSSNEAHVWQATLDQINAAQQLLSPDELARAARFKFERDQQRYITAHAMLRRILAGYANCAPAELRFEINAFGKPHLVGIAGIHFNLSHSQDVVVVAVANVAVGVDVEHIRPLPDLLDMAQHFFRADETETLRQLSPDLQPSAFFRAWVRKEAYLKATGAGLSSGLDAIRVHIGPQAGIGVWEPLDARWQVQELPALPLHVCALATDISVQRVKTFSFEH